MSSGLQNRPRLLNVAHWLRLVSPLSGTTAEELACLARHAKGRRLAAEIGTHMGVSAAVIAGALDARGLLYCIDPWMRRRFLENPSLLICRRELGRQGVYGKIRILRGYSAAMSGEIPEGLDFMFIDGDHSREGISVDWALARRKLAPGGIVCLHDTSIPAHDPERHLGSVDYFREVILPDTQFERIEELQSMNVLLRHG